MNSNTSQPDRNMKNACSGSKRYPTTIALGILLLSLLGVAAQANSRAAATGKSWFADPIVGTWEVVVDVTNCNTGDSIASGGQALALFNADGTRHETNATNPALRTPGYGNWHRVENNEYEFAFKFFRFDSTGAYIGSTSVRHDLFLSADATSYYSEGIAEFLDPANNLLFVGCGSATATRYE